MSLERPLTKTEPWPGLGLWPHVGMSFPAADRVLLLQHKGACRPAALCRLPGTWPWGWYPLWKLTWLSPLCEQSVPLSVTGRTVSLATPILKCSGAAVLNADLPFAQQDPFPRSSTQPTQCQVPDTSSTPHCTAVHLAQTRRSWVGASAPRSLLSHCLLV